VSAPAPEPDPVALEPVTPADPADRLADEVYREWARVAAERHLDEPIPLCWRRASEEYGKPSLNPPEHSRTPALPGLAPVTEQLLERGGTLDSLYALYGGVPRGRLLIVGEPGAGKTSAAIILALHALQRRRQAGPDAHLLPVPVLLGPGGWDRDIPIEAWLVRRLVRTYPGLAGRSGQMQAQDLVRDGRVVLILDDLDAVEESLRPALLQELARSGLRVVLLARKDTMQAVAVTSYFHGAVAIEIMPVPGPVGAAYLRDRPTRSSRAKGWDRVLSTLEEDAGHGLSRALSSPLALTLLRDTFQTEQDDTALLLESPADPRTIEDALLRRLISYAYNPASGPLPPFTEARARRTLTFLARRMSTTGTDHGRRRASTSRDLAWWHLGLWAPRWPRIAVTLLMFAVGGWLYAGARGAAGGAILSTGALLALSLREAEPIRLVRPRWRALAAWQVLLAGLLLGTGSGLAYALQYGWFAGLQVALVAGAGGWLVVGVFTGISGSMYSGRSPETGTLTSAQSWRNDVVGSLLRGVVGGIAFGLVTGTLYGLLGPSLAPVVTGGLAEPMHDYLLGLAESLLVGSVLYGVAAGILIGGLFGVVYSQAWIARLAMVQLWLRRRTPLRLLTFLDDALQRGVLRSVGPVYQFRHARLQDLLADEDRRH
jgi:hypothetical protein